MDELVARLSKGKHPIKAGLLSERTAEAFHQRILNEYVHIEFTDTKGRTILGVQLDKAASDISKADFKEQKGKVHLEGGLSLNYNQVRCIADIDLATLDGKGSLQLVGGT
jgi:Core binding factor beta subunit